VKKPSDALLFVVGAWPTGALSGHFPFPRTGDRRLHQILAILDTRFYRLSAIIPIRNGWEAPLPIYFNAHDVNTANARLKKALEAKDASFEAGLAKLFPTPSPRRRAVPVVAAAQPAGPHETAGWSLSRKDNGRRERRF
jgi:hypothetical protein